ncbi:MAG TPA: TonB-dependent receptor, partial [Cryomorphaceae bacterium]|nr:TonB-dependent receptor [Cryomorphaceae bacterium]
LMPCGLMAQVISGTIVNPKDEPLSGAHIVIDEGGRAVFTQVNGTFELKNLKPGPHTLRISHLGYETKEKEVNASWANENVRIVLNPSPFLTDEVVVEATRLSRKAPATFKNIESKEIQKLNLGQDLPILLNWTPSLVATSDAGAGVGYTGMRIRGSDQTRINVTLNGIPINDAESQGVFWVNMPDLATSLSSVQIQRGLGSSTNGSGAFGASVNMETNLLDEGAGGMVSSSAGSFNTFKNTVQVNTGRMENGFAMEGRLSSIQSDGYIDRASSDLKSYYLSGGYFGENTVVKAITFGGKERTYQSWYGTPESRLENDVEAMNAHADREGYAPDQRENLLNSGRTYNFYQYENEVDDYQQDHYQLHLIQKINPFVQLRLAGHYTYGRGFFEQYRRGDEYADYGKPNPMIGDSVVTESDFIRRRWLDNDFYGGTFALDYEKGDHKIILGGGAHLYRGDHFGEIVWAEVAGEIDHLEEYYRGVGNKDDLNVYAKWEYSIKRFQLMADMQLRSVYYEAFGTDNDLSAIDVNRDFLFFNPKVGGRYTLDRSSSVYLYAGMGNREPVRNDFIDALPGEQPEHETMQNIELGYTYGDSRLKVNANGYFMNYQNQLVLTGELNDVGSSIRRNADHSYRLGVELDATWYFSEAFNWNVNATFSRNKIRNYENVVYDYTDGFDVLTETYEDTDISFSPAIIAASRLNFKPFDGLEVNLNSKYVGEQYLDNTQNEDRKIEAYFVNDLRVAYTVENLVFKKVQFTVLVNNILDERYVSNGYTYSYIVGDEITENFYYPQAGINFLAGVNLIF